MIYIVATTTPHGVKYWVHQNVWTHDPMKAAWGTDEDEARKDADRWSDYWAVNGYGKQAYVAKFKQGELEV